MTDDAAWRRIAEMLGRHDVEFLIVGGVGARLHGAVRPTKDFDSLASSDRANLDRLAGAMRDLTRTCASRVSVTTRPGPCRHP